VTVAVRLMEVEPDPDDPTFLYPGDVLDQYVIDDGDLKRCAVGWQTSATFNRRVRTSKGWARVTVFVRVEHDQEVKA
jgi:hypothetical protein